MKEPITERMYRALSAGRMQQQREPVAYLVGIAVVPTLEAESGVYPGLYVDESNLRVWGIRVEVDESLPPDTIEFRHRDDP